MITPKRIAATTGLVALAAGVLVWVGLPTPPAHAQVPAKTVRAKVAPAGITAAHAADLSAALKAIDTATQAVASGNKAAALAALKIARAKVQATRDAVQRALPAPRYANTRCPMMGSKIDPSKVAPNLVREFKGQKVAFCCGGCPAAWDKLADADKGDKLAKVAAPAPKCASCTAGKKCAKCRAVSGPKCGPAGCASGK